MYNLNGYHYILFISKLYSIATPTPKIHNPVGGATGPLV